MMRVLAVIDSLDQGGAERSLIEQARALQRHGVQTTIFMLHPTYGGFAEEAVRGGLTLHEAISRTRHGLIREIRRMIRASDADLVHTTLFESDVLGRLASAYTGVPVLTSLVNTSYVDSRHRDPLVTSWKLALARYLDSWTARAVNTHFHAISEVVAEAGIDSLGINRAQVTVIPRGREPTRLGENTSDRRRRVRRSLGIDESTPVVLNVGRHEYQKDQMTLIEAGKNLYSRTGALRVLIAGREGNETERLERKIKDSGLAHVATLLGFRNDIPDLLCAADAFVFPSRFEGLGGSLLEAMALEVPIVATDIPSSREVLGDTALLVPVGDPEALADAMGSALAHDAAVGSRAVAARARFDERYAFDVTVQAMADLYDRLSR